MKIERLIGIIMLLLQRELVSASEMAAMFEVTKRTIYRDIDTLSMANIPIYTLPGVKGGIGIMPTYKVDKKLLTVEDLTAIITGLSGFEQLLSSTDIKKTLLKMKNMLGHENQLPAASISLDFSNLAMKQEFNENVEQLHLAIKKQQLVALTYIDRDGNQTTRKVEPYHLLFRNRSWYLQGYSLERQDFRTFKLSRVLELEVSAESFEARPFILKPFQSQASQPPFEMTEVHLIVDKIAREQIAMRFGMTTIEPLDASHFSAKVMLPNHEAGYRFLLHLGAHVTVRKSGDFYEDFVAYLKEIQSKYD
ncbi:YafY family transcriptional regulator [Listeria grandensis]|uniref:helix-turn-helix transcriptional regulator n=1 Tax=Listeria grandensis TaxID=1494963 RepID=UPI001628F1F9|nr:YafY family protein [Listeria grandensis]MBC1475035.1 YafY family transcriptional regulator [Listeria grandensis]